MNPIWWTILGVVICLVAMVPLVRFLLVRGEKRARDAERRARDSERLAELGAMTGGLAHEIKNPLSTVGLNAQLLSEGIRDAELADYERQRLLKRVESLRREIERLRDILQDFLQFAGRFQLDPQPVDVVRIATELSDFFLPQCEQANVLLRPQLPEKEIVVLLDEGLFKQALLNLMINAVQAISATDNLDSHARVGELMIRIEETEDGVTIHVIDTGPGIAEDRLEGIFHPYVSGRIGGSGLGLPIAKRIVEEHGGRLTVNTELGRGSDFVIHLSRAYITSDLRSNR